MIVYWYMRTMLALAEWANAQAEKAMIRWAGRRGVSQEAVQDAVRAGCLEAVRTFRNRPDR